MSENMSQAETLKEAFEEGIKDVLPDDPNIDDEILDNPDELPETYEREPNDDDGEDYWKGFAESKGWSDDPSKAKPGYFTDYRAFISKYGTMQDAKLSKSDLAEMKELMKETAKQTGEITKQQREQGAKEVAELKLQLEAAKANAKEALDFDSFEEADAKLKEIESATEKEAPKEDEPQIFRSFRADNPLVNHDSPDFDAELNGKVEAAVNLALKSGSVTTEYQLMKVMDKALDEAKGKPAKAMPKAPATNSANNGNARVTKLDPSKLDSASRNMYDFYKRKGLDDVAKDFLKSSLGA